MTVVDMSKTIAPKSDQLNADDLIAGPRTITIRQVSASGDSNDQPVSIYFEGDDNKPYKPCKSMRRVMVMVWGDDGRSYPGKKMTLYNDPNVKFGGIAVGGIRISHMTGLDRQRTLSLTATRGRRAPYIVKPLVEAETDDPMDRAKAAAKNGVEAFREFWNSDYGKDHRDTLKSQLETLQAIATQADAPPPEEDHVPLSQRLSEAKDEAQAHEFDADAVDPFADEYAAGIAAQKDGAGEDTNPHDPGTLEHNNWLGGFRFQVAQGGDE